MFPVNCYVLWDDTKEAVVIDAGCYYPEEQQRLKDFLVNNGLQLKHLLNTHLHLDHIFGNAFMEREFGIKPEANQEDEFWLAKAAGHCRMFGFQINESPAPLGGYICDGDVIRFGNTNLEAIHVPGHSRAAWSSTAGQPTVCSAEMLSSREASDVQTWKAAILKH